MTVTVTTPQPEQNVNNGSECYADISFVDTNGNPYIPSSLQYRVDDLTNALSIVPWTPLTPPPIGATLRVTITAAQNIMNALSRLRERRQVLFQVGIPGGTTRYDDTTYSLVRRVGTP